MKFNVKQYVLVNISFYYVTTVLLSFNNVTCRGVSLPEITGISFRRHDSKDVKESDDRHQVIDTQSTEAEPGETSCKGCRTMKTEQPEKANREPSVTHTKRKRRKKKRTKVHGSTSNIQIENLKSEELNIPESTKHNLNDEYRNEKTKLRTNNKFPNTNAEMLPKAIRKKHSKNRESKKRKSDKSKSADFRLYSHNEGQLPRSRFGRKVKIENSGNKMVQPSKEKYQGKKTKAPSETELKIDPNKDGVEFIGDKSERQQKHLFNSSSIFRKTDKTVLSDNQELVSHNDKWTLLRGSNVRDSRHRSTVQVPHGVSRIERRLRPSIHAYGAEILSSLQRMLRQVQYGVQTLHLDYQYMFNSTRYNMMLGVREELTDITIESDKIYDVVLKMSKMARKMHRYGQRNQQAAPPQELQKPPKLLSVDFRDKVYDVENLQRKANSTKRDVQSMNMQCQQLKAQSMEFDSRLKERVPDVQLVDLRFLANRTIWQLTDVSAGDIVKLKVQRYKNMDKDLSGELSNATGYYRLAHKNLVTAMEIHQLNVAHHDQIIKSHRRRSAMTQPAAVVATDSLDPSVRAALKDIVSKASSYAKELDEILHIVKGRISPVLQSAQLLLNVTGDSAIQLHLVTVKKFLKDAVKDISHVLDRIRVILGDEHVIKARCEQIADHAEGSGFLENVESPIDCEDYIEGSGVDMETELLVKTETDVILPLSEDTEDTEDFFFGIFSDDPNVEMSTFGGKLEEFASNLHSKSEEKFQKSDKIKEKTKDISRRWSTTASHVKQMTKNSDKITDFLNSWEERQLHMKNVNNRISSAIEQIYFKFNLTQTKAVHAERTIDRLKQTIKAGDKKERTSNDQPGGLDVAAVSNVIEVVGKVKGKVNSIITLKRVFLDPCQKLRDQAAWLQSNITELKRKIEKASLVTSSLKMSVSLSGSGHIRIPLHQKISQSLTTSVSLCVQPTGGDAPLAVIQGNHSATFALAVYNEKLVLTVYGQNGRQLHRLNMTSSMESGKWYRIRLNRYGQHLTLAISPFATTSEDDETSTEISIPEMKPLQLMPNILYLGGIPDKMQDVYGEGLWMGCITNVFIDSHHIGLLRNDSSGHKPKPCEKCPGLDKMSIVMEGGGYVKFPLSVLGESVNVHNINLVFRTHQPRGLLFMLNQKRQHVQLLMSLVDGRLLLEARIFRGTFGGTTVTRSTSSLYSDGNLHEINVRLLSDRIEINTDDGEDQFVQETSTQEIPTQIQDGIYLGGINGLVHSSLHDKFRPLRGCVPNLKLNDRVLPLAVLEDARNVYLGNCNEDIWTTCVRFSEESLPVSLPEREKLKTLYLAITPDSRGPVLHYRKGKTLSLVIVSDDQGLEVTEVSTDTSGRITVEAEQTQLWYFITITDRVGKIEIESGGEKLTMEYNENSKGWWTDKKPLPAKVEITVGGFVDDDEITGGFIGAISTILVDDSPVSLQSNMTENSLKFCTKPLLIKTEPKPYVKLTC